MGAGRRRFISSRRPGHTATPEHPLIPELKDQVLRGAMGRRDFLRTATLLGLSAPAAYGFVSLLSAADDPGARAAGLKSPDTNPKTGGTLRVSMRLLPITDPAIFDWGFEANVTRHLLEYLTITGPDNVTRPYLLERWSVSEDLKTWDLHLRPGIRWSNGDAFTAEDVAHNFRRWLDPATGSSNQGLFSAMVSEVDTGKRDENGAPVLSKRMTEGAVEVVDPLTVRLHLNRPDLSIPENLYNYPTAIVHRRFDDWGGDFLKEPVGTGPFKLEQFAVGEQAILRNRNDYWGEPPLLDRIVYVDHGDDAAAAIAAAASGQVDLLHEIAVEQTEIIKHLPKLQIFETVTAQTAVARMQMNQKPFDDVRVRRAVRLCQDHDRLLELSHRGRGAPAEDHHVAPIHPEYAPLPRPKQDHAQARRLLADAGYADGIDLSIDCQKDPPWELACVQALTEMCKPAGIRLKINLLPSAQYWKVWRSTPFGFTRWAHRPLGVMTLNLGYRSGVPWNETNHADPQFDRLLDAASAEIDPARRQAVMVDVQKRLQDNAVIAQPLWRSVFAAGSTRLRGYRLHPTIYHQLNKVWLA